MNTRQLRYLVTVARIGNLSHAAGHLGISQPALSKLIRTWEETYGFPLFLRFGHKLAPTAIGRLYLDYAQRILDEQNRMILTMRSMGGEQGQSIRLCTAPNRASIIYSEIFHRFARVYPDIELNWRWVPDLFQQRWKTYRSQEMNFSSLSPPLTLFLPERRYS